MFRVKKFRKFLLRKKKLNKEIEGIISSLECEHDITFYTCELHILYGVDCTTEI